MQGNVFSAYCILKLMIYNNNVLNINLQKGCRKMNKEKYNRDNFYKDTFARFTACKQPKAKPDYVSTSGSAYWFRRGGVIRRSDHWGSNVASCHWYLSRSFTESWLYNKGTRCGFCKFADFKNAICREHDIIIRIVRKKIQAFKKREARRGFRIADYKKVQLTTDWNIKLFCSSYYRAVGFSAGQLPAHNVQ